ncbi:MAG: molybdopterin-dependent oxidoreductase [Desulfobacterales bacterium]|nr:molybdopterin-dependent oxidoreductase [Desulfobacterales bacterium]
MKNYTVIGKRLPRKDGLVKATGEARFTTDIALPGMLYGKILRSPHAHAGILHIDAGKALKLPGVRAVITGKELGVPFSLVDIPRKHPANKFPLAQDRVRFIGDEVAAVAAIDEDVAEEALERIQVDYQGLPAVFDVDEAMKPGAPRIHDHAEGNICWRELHGFGDVAGDFEKADVIREDEFTLPSVAHAALEPHCCVAQFDASGKLTLWTSTQSVHRVRLGLAKSLNMREGDVRVIKPFVGGGFGGKYEMMAFEPIAARLSQKAGLPVKLTLTREEVFIGTRLRHRGVFRLKTGFKKDGTLLTIDGRSIFDAGAYNSLGIVANKLSAMHFGLTYRFSSLKYETSRVFTNNPLPGAMRGFGAPQTDFAVESQMDMIAEQLGMDPAELRLKNALQPNCTTPNKLIINSCGLTECIQQARDKSGRHPKGQGAPDGHGAGMACAGFTSGTMNRYRDSEPFSAAVIRANGDGSVNLLVGAADIGQGSDTTLCQIVAEALGITLDDIQIISADTEITPIDQGTYASRITIMVGNAALDAATRIKDRLLTAVAEKLEIHADDLEARDRRIYVKGTPDIGVSFAEAVTLCQRSQGGRPVISDGYYDLGKRGCMDTKSGAPFDPPPAFSFCAHFAQVQADKETGLVKVRSITPAHDIGLAINPMGAEGQLEGSILMGLGYALTEEILWDQGKIMNPSLLDYECPTALDMPEINPIFVETIDPEGPFGAKECGEGAMTPVAPAITNAIHAAIGIRINEIPLTPEKVLAALEKKEVL